MNIGIVTAWYERGAAYVSKMYKDLLEQEGHVVYIFARGGFVSKNQLSERWKEKEITRSEKYTDTTIEKRKLYSWIKKKNLNAILFNEQNDFRVLIWLKNDFPEIKLGAYVDYYTEATLPWFDLYDFLICNTKRHIQAMKDHPQKYYLKWGTDIELYKPSEEKHREVRFFHSVGMSPRKGTDILVNAFINGKLYEKSKLILHTQIPIEKVTAFKKDDLQKYGIEVIDKTVTAPGLYYLGDVYVYPTRLDGLGLTMYEALASGLPMITSDFPPMNEVGTEDFVKRIKIADYYCRSDAYYFPMVICDEKDLTNAMNWYVQHPDELLKQKKMAREYAVENCDISKKGAFVSKIFIDSTCRPINKKLAKEVLKTYKRNWNVFQTLSKLKVVYNIRHKSK